MTPSDLLGAALAVAREGLDAGELPIGAVVAVGDEIVGRAYTQDRGQARRLAHADVLAMTAADHALGWGRRPHPVRLAVTLEPCLMCMGAAMSLGVAEVYYGLEAPGDGAAAIAAAWQPGPGMEWYVAPAVTGGIRRAECRDLYERYCTVAPDSAFRRWARTMADLPDAV